MTLNDEDKVANDWIDKVELKIFEVIRLLTLILFEIIGPKTDKLDSIVASLWILIDEATMIESPTDKLKIVELPPIDMPFWEIIESPNIVSAIESVEPPRILSKILNSPWIMVFEAIERVEDNTVCCPTYNSLIDVFDESVDEPFTDNDDDKIVLPETSVFWPIYKLLIDVFDASVEGPFIDK